MKTTLREIEEWTGHKAPKDPSWWPGLAAVLFLALLILLLAASVSCTLTVAPDGTRTWQADTPAIARALIDITAAK